jgi:hypothetical protein
MCVLSIDIKFINGNTGLGAFIKQIDIKLVLIQDLRSRHLSQLLTQ